MAASPKGVLSTLLHRWGAKYQAWKVKRTAVRRHAVGKKVGVINLQQEGRCRAGQQW
jgi:hypothetical protein